MGTESRHRGKPDEDLLAAMDRAFSGQMAGLDRAQRAAVEAWQRTDRSYEITQRLARSGCLDDLSAADLAEAESMQRHLDEAIALGRLPFALTVFRGVRSLRDTIGHERPEDVVGLEVTFDGYCATSVLRYVAIDEFTTPAGALFDIRLDAGTPALWVGGAGRARLRHQGELLLSDGLRIRFVGYRRETGIAILESEAINP